MTGKRSADFPLRDESGVQGQQGLHYVYGQGYQGLGGINRGQLVVPGVRVSGLEKDVSGVHGLDSVDVKHGKA